MVVSISDSILVCDLPPGRRDQNNFSPFSGSFEATGAGAGSVVFQSPSHHIISELKSSPPQAIETIRSVPRGGRLRLCSASRSLRYSIPAGREGNRLLILGAMDPRDSETAVLRMHLVG